MIYKRVYIYKLICNKSNKQYIGSTTTTIKRRIQGHLWNYEAYQHNDTNRKRVGRCSSFSILELSHYNFRVELLAVRHYINKKERYTLENSFLQNILKSSLKIVNENIPSRTSKQYQIDHRERLNQRYRTFYGERYRTKKKEYYNNVVKKQKVKCNVCNCIYGKRNEKTHLLTKKHKNNLEKALINKK